MKDLKDRVAVVTGAASGIGRALATRFAQEGMSVMLADIEPGALSETERQLAAAGHRVASRRTDVSRADELNALAEATLDAFGKVHVVCNNAGVITGGLSWEAPVSDYEWVLGVNVWGVIHGIRTFVPILLEQGEDGHVVNTASMAGVTTAAFSGAYYLSKHAAVSLSETLFHELATKSDKIGVSVLCPELINTGIGRSDRNRPAHLKRGEDEGGHPEREMIEGLLRDITSTGLDPAEMADRVVSAIRERRFYVLSAPGGTWRKALETRCDDLRQGRNPSLTITAANY